APTAFAVCHFRWPFHVSQFTVGCTYVLIWYRSRRTAVGGATRGVVLGPGLVAEKLLMNMCERSEKPPARMVGLCRGDPFCRSIRVAGQGFCGATCCDE